MTAWWRKWDVEVVSALLCLLAGLMLWGASGCQTAATAGGTVAEWIACPTDLIDCGHVYECEAVADNELGHVEICIDDDDQPEQVAEVEALYGQCDPTPRHQGLCLYCCGAECGRGGNAFNGTYCP